MSYAKDIQAQIEDQLEAAENLFRKYPEQVHAVRPVAKRWSGLEALGHLNKTLEFYISHIEHSIAVSIERGQKPNTHFIPGFLGSRMTRYMAPKNGIIRMKVRTMPEFQPALENEKLKPVLKQFNSLMEQLGKLAKRAERVDLGKTKVRIPRNRLVKFKLGDTFPFILAHNERHLLQAQRAMELAQES